MLRKAGGKGEIKRKRGRKEEERTEGRQRGRENAKVSGHARFQRNGPVISLYPVWYMRFCKGFRLHKERITLHHSTLHSMVSLLPTAFLPALTQSFLTLPHHLSGRCKTEQGGVEEKHKRRLSAHPLSPQTIPNSFSYYEMKLPYLRTHSRHSVSSEDRRVRSPTLLTPSPRPRILGDYEFFWTRRQQDTSTYCFGVKVGGGLLSK